jgi:hypothetical protein
MPIHISPLECLLSEAGGDTYHHHSLSPQSNGMGERAHRKIKDALCTCLAGAEWPLHLPWSSLASALLQKRTQQFHQPNWFMALHSLCLASSLPQRNGLQLTTSRSSSRLPLSLQGWPHMLRPWLSSGQAAQGGVRLPAEWQHGATLGPHLPWAIQGFGGQEEVLRSR